MPLNIVMGVTDSRTVVIEHIGPHKTVLAYPGNASFVSDEAKKDNANLVIFLGPGTPASNDLVVGPIINLISDADLCKRALGHGIVNASRLGRPWFNHPGRVLRNTRDGSSKMLQGIPGVIVPKVTRVTPKDLGDIDSAVRASRHRYPVLVRRAGAHDTHSLLKLTGPKDSRKLLELAFDGTEYYITDFYELKAKDGFYRKYRIAVVGGVPYIRHMIVAKTWRISTSDDRIWNDKTIDEERTLIESFPDRLGQSIQPAIRQIYDRLELDFFGMDLSFDQEGRMVLFEANASMQILTNISRLPDLWSGAIRRIEDAVQALIDQPHCWATVEATGPRTAAGADRARDAPCVKP